MTKFIFSFADLKVNSKFEVVWFVHKAKEVVGSFLP